MDFLIKRIFSCQQIKNCKLSKKEISMLHFSNVWYKSKFCEDMSRGLRKHFLSFGFPKSDQMWSKRSCSQELPFYSGCASDQIECALRC